MLVNLWIEFYGEGKEEDINCEPKCKVTNKFLLKWIEIKNIHC